MRVLLLFCSIITLSIAVLSCESGKKSSGKSESGSHDHGHEGHNHAAHDHPEPGPNEVEFSDEQANLVNLMVQPVEYKNYQHVIKAVGELSVPIGDETYLVAPSSGVLSYTVSNLSNGISISPGQTIARISAKDLLYGDPLEKTKAEFEMAKREMDRAEKLIADSLISQSDFERIRLNYEKLRVSYQALSGNIQQGKVEVRSPDVGFVKDILVKNGEYVAVGQTIMILTKNQRIQLKVDVSPKYAHLLPHITSANFKIPGKEDAYSMDLLKGKVLHYGKSLEENSHYMNIIFDFNNQGDFIPGTFSEVYLIGHNIGESVVIPRSALIEEQGLYSVYVKTGKHPIYKKKPVTLGMDNGLSVQVLKGIQPGERLVTQGAYYLKLASMSSAIPHGHAH